MRLRTGLNRGICLLIAACGSISHAAIAHDPPVAHQAVVERFLSLREIGGVRPSPDGRFLAVEIMRARASAARRGQDGFRKARSDLWLIDLADGPARQLTFGERDGSAFWDPIWSPDSRRMAFLTNIRDGVVRAGWMEVREPRVRIFSDSPVDVEVNFGSERALRDGRVWGAWIDPHSFLMAITGAGEVGMHFEAGVPELVYGPRWANARAGRASVTVWDSVTNPVCHRNDSLVTVDVRASRAPRIHFHGAIRAVTLAPGSERAAVVFATRARAPLGDEAAVFNPEYTWQSLDPRVHTALVAIDLKDNRTLATSDLDGFRFQSRSDGARWSDDAQAVYVPRYETVERTAADFAVVALRLAGSDGGKPEVIHLTPQTRIHAQLLSLSLSHVGSESGPDTATRVARTAIALGSTANSFGNDVTLFTLGPGMLGTGTSDGIGLIDLASGAIMDRISLVGNSVIAAQSPQFPGAAAAVLQTASGLRWLRADRGRLMTGNIAQPDAGLVPRVLVPHSNVIVWIGRGPQGDSLWTSALDGSNPRRRIALERPQVGVVGQVGKVAFHYRLPNGETAVAALLLPPDYDSRKPYPLVIDAYPGRVVRESRVEEIFDPDIFHNVDSFAFAAAGYIVARPSIPDGYENNPDYEPLSYLSSAVEFFAQAAIERRLSSAGSVGLFGHSNGGYTGLAVAARTQFISAIVVSSPFPDIMGVTDRPYVNGTVDDCAPNRFFGDAPSYAEDPQGPLWRMGAPVHRALDRYILSSPLYHLGANTPPTLIVQGQFDSAGTVDSERTYIRLARRGVPVQLARYWGEGHNFDGPGNIRDRVQRELTWFGTYLKPAAGEAKWSQPSSIRGWVVK